MRSTSKKANAPGDRAGIGAGPSASGVPWVEGLAGSVDGSSAAIDQIGSTSRALHDTAERFSEQNPDLAISVSGPGSGDGAELGCSGEIPIRNASRQLKDPERQDRIARALADTIENFLEDTGRRIAATEGRG